MKVFTMFYSQNRRESELTLSKRLRNEVERRCQNLSEIKSANITGIEYEVLEIPHLDRKFCYCGLETVLRMVGCSKKECRKQWYHCGDGGCVDYDDKVVHGTKWHRK
jgi:hypothetical protein